MHQIICLSFQFVYVVIVICSSSMFWSSSCAHSLVSESIQSPSPRRLSRASQNTCLSFSFADSLSLSVSKSHDVMHISILKIQKKASILEKRTPDFRLLAGITNIYPLQIKTSSGPTWVKPDNIYFVSRIKPLHLFEDVQVSRTFRTVAVSRILDSIVDMCTHTSTHTHTLTHSLTHTPSNNRVTHYRVLRVCASIS